MITNPTRSHYVILAFLWLAVHLFILQHCGIRDLYDANIYVKSADFLIKQGDLIDSQHIFYLTHVVLVGLFRIAFPHQIMPFFIFQSLLSGFAMLALYKAAIHIFRNGIAGLMTGIIYLMWWDNIQWNMTAMSESIFSSVICFIIFYLSKYERSRKDLVRIVLLLIILFFTRPTSIIIIAGVAIYFIIYYQLELKQKPMLRATVFLSVGLIAALGSMMMFSLWDFTEQYHAGNIVTYMDSIRGTDLYSPEMVIEPVDVKFADDSHHPLLKMMYFIFMNPLYFLKTASLKVWYLISFSRPYYSASHNLISILWVGVINLLTCIGIRQCTNRPLKAFVISVVTSNCLLIAISTVDWDNRFFIPMEAGLVLMAGGGASTALNFVIGLGQRKKHH